MTAQVIMILDGSSSMLAHKTKTIEGFNKFLIEQQANEIPTEMSVITFHGGDPLAYYNEPTNIRTIVDRIPVADVKPLTHETYRTNGNTNLLDAIGYTLEQDLQTPTICILTDGEENTSNKYTYEAIKTLVEQREQQGWAFVFLGANIETFAVGQMLGFGQHNTLSYNTNNIDASLASASRVVNSLKTRDIHNVSAAYASSAFTDSERKSSV
jgi:uncharacterized protein YegL